MVAKLIKNTRSQNSECFLLFDISCKCHINVALSCQKRQKGFVAFAVFGFAHDFEIVEPGLFVGGVQLDGT